jgi:hypothetical protein
MLMFDILKHVSHDLYNISDMRQAIMQWVERLSLVRIPTFTRLPLCVVLDTVSRGNFICY